MSLDSVQRGLTRYIDSELGSKMDGWQRWVFCAGAGAYISKAPDICKRIRDDKRLAILGLVDDVNNVDVDMIYRYLRPAAEKAPATVTVPMMGTITFTVDDVDMLYNCIMRG